MHKNLIIPVLLAIVCICNRTNAQNLFPYKLNNCVTSAFCLDCGDEKAGVNQQEFDKLIESLNKSNNYSRISGKVLLQVLVDSLGNGCVLSHTDNSNSPIVQNIVKSFNEFTGWIPAKTKGKIVGKTSINLSVEIKNGVLASKIERVDQKAFLKSFDRPRDPEIFNKDYVYNNPNLNNYNIQVWDSKNSSLPDNFNDHIAIDKNDIIWLTIQEGLVKFDGKSFINSEQNITEKGDFFGYSALASDNENIKWVDGKSNIYSYNDTKWTLYDMKKIGFNGAYKIVDNAKTGEVFFCSDSGLVIFKHGVWSKLNKANTEKLPSNRVYFAKRDSKGRLWIGTFSGSVLIDANGKETAFNDADNILNGKCVSSMDEDENGNVFLGLYEYDRKDKKSANSNEGIAIYYSNGEIKQFTTSNSGMPFNHVTKVLYDKHEKVLWIATDRAGLVRYDLKDGWENYHNKNSKIPTSYISDMAFDSKGILYLATRQGMVKVERK